MSLFRLEFSKAGFLYLIYVCIFINCDFVMFKFDKKVQVVNTDINNEALLHIQNFFNSTSYELCKYTGKSKAEFSISNHFFLKLQLMLIMF